MDKTEQFYELDEDIVDLFKKLEKDFGFAMNIKYIFQANAKQKSLIKISKIPDNYAVLLKADMLVTVNESYFNLLDDDKIRIILFEQEIDKIYINLDRGTIKLVQPNLKTSIGLIKRHTYELVEKANETERLLGEQKNDQDM